MKQRFEFPTGATPLLDCSDLIPAWVHNLGDLNRVEAENIAEAQKKYLSKRSNHPKVWFDVPGLKAIHKLMFANVWKWAGAYRKSVTSIGIKPSLIPNQLAEFCDEVQSWNEYPVELTFLEMAARIHHRLVFIHPFENGNGRFSRLVSDRFLVSWHCPYPIWPNHLNQEGGMRKEYIKALKCADEGDYDPLIDLMTTYGASDPKFNELFKNRHYRRYMSSPNGVAIVKALLRRRNNPNERDSKGRAALHFAEKEGLEEIARLLRQPYS